MDPNSMLNNSSAEDISDSKTTSEPSLSDMQDLFVKEQRKFFETIKSSFDAQFQSLNDNLLQVSRQVNLNSQNIESMDPGKTPAKKRKIEENPEEYVYDSQEVYGEEFSDSPTKQPKDVSEAEPSLSCPRAHIMMILLRSLWPPQSY